jgi:hypothetical protein
MLSKKRDVLLVVSRKLLCNPMLCHIVLDHLFLVTSVNLCRYSHLQCSAALAYNKYYFKTHCNSCKSPFLQQMKEFIL